ncbi:OsmC family protein [Spirillospora albida]|uniref:OsmC family protein n=1 Tax=Spirillospora albida TaxID=58123 RepID=UPI0006899654|nr:OsmC family protein [Spirillospora albida]
MTEIRVVHSEGDAFAVVLRDHVVSVDQPYSAGGTDTGPTPVELFVASVAACAAHCARGHLRRLGLPAGGLEVTADFAMGEGALAGVSRIALAVRPPLAVRGAVLDGLLDAVRRCAVRNSIIDPPRIGVEVVAEGTAVAAASAV